MRFLVKLCLGLLVAIVALAIFGNVVACGGVRNSQTAKRNACIHNLRIIDAAKERWASEESKKPGEPVTEADLNHLLTVRPKCPSGGNYDFGKVGAAPTCTVAGHTLQ